MIFFTVIEKRLSLCMLMGAANDPQNIFPMLRVISLPIPY